MFNHQGVQRILSLLPQMISQ